MEKLSTLTEENKNEYLAAVKLISTVTLYWHLCLGSNLRLAKSLAKELSSQNQCLELSLESHRKPGKFWKNNVLSRILVSHPRQAILPLWANETKFSHFSKPSAFVKGL